MLFALNKQYVHVLRFRMTAFHFKALCGIVNKNIHYELILIQKMPLPLSPKNKKNKFILSVKKNNNYEKITFTFCGVINGRFC